MDRTTAGSLIKRSKARDDGGLICEACGYTPPPRLSRAIMEAHHIQRVADGGTHSEDNLIVLCANCHRIAHALFPCVGAYRPVPSREELIEALADPAGFINRQRAKARTIIEDIH
jgi:5-methylcytosine-specific restriction endonuclease McrA